MKILKISLLALLAFMLEIPFVKADEGMWLPLFLKNREADMQSKGFKLSAEDVYSVNQSSLKDAILLFGRGCTGELVSKQGLLFTNHHCGHGAIQQHSSLEKDYLTKGFWAQNMKEELPCKGLSVKLLIRMEDVSERILSAKDKKEAIKQIENEAIKGTHYTAEVKPFFYGNQYFLFVNEEFKDVRLVGAPPSNIGKFGGDTDNWMWPRHTGDFALFRIYVGKDNKPSEYNENNIPYTPKRFLQISLNGVEENDFTFVFGYPGRTQEYLSSYAVESLSKIENPLRIEARTKRLDAIKAGMDSDPLIRIQYSAKSATIANGWKKWIGENKGIESTKIIEKKKKFEKDFQAWTSTTEGKAYLTVLPSLKKKFNELSTYLTLSTYFNEVTSAPELVQFSYRFEKLVKLCENKNVSDNEIKEEVEKLKKTAEGFFKDFNKNVDQQVFIALGNVKIDGEVLKIVDFPDVDYNTHVKKMYATSIFGNAQTTFDFLNNFKRKDANKITNDLMYQYSSLVYGQYKTQTQPLVAQYYKEIDSLQKLYMKGMMEMQTEKIFYPDANSTLRVAYGKVEGFKPADAIKYNYYTTLKGIMEKENPEVYDYVVESRLKELYTTKDYGKYANKKGEMPVAFIASNHTTGGNSGSPVLNANGELIGINFDRNWQGTMSDIVYDPEICRNIALDIRYCLFIIDKYAGAKWLIEELGLY